MDLKFIEICMKIWDFRKNPNFFSKTQDFGFSGASEIFAKSQHFAKIRNFCENVRFLRKSEIFDSIRDDNMIFAKVRDFRQKFDFVCKNIRFSRKYWIFAKIRDFRENLGFSRNSENVTKIWDWSKTYKPQFTNLNYQRCHYLYLTPPWISILPHLRSS